MSLVHKFYISLAILVIASSSCKTSNSDVASIEPGKDVLKREGDASTAIMCVASEVSPDHQKVFDTLHTEDAAKTPNQISFRSVYNKYFLDTFATIPVGLLHNYFIHKTAYIQLTQGFDDNSKYDLTSELIIKDQSGRVAALMRGKRDKFGFLEVPKILINLSADVVAAIDAGLNDEMEKKLRSQLSILPMTFAVYFAYGATTLLPRPGNPVELYRAAPTDVYEAKRQLAHRMLVEMRHEAATNPAIFSDDLKALINNNELMKPIDMEASAFLATPEGSKDYDKFIAFYGSGGAREFTNWTLANFMESSICAGDYKDPGDRKYDPVKYQAADSFYKNEMRAQLFDGIVDAGKEYTGQKVSTNNSANGRTGLAGEEYNLTTEGPNFKPKEKLRTSAGFNLFLFPFLRGAIFYSLVAIRNVAAAIVYAGGNVMQAAGNIVGNVVVGTGRFLFGNPVYVNQQMYSGGGLNYGNVATTMNSQNYQGSSRPGPVVRLIRFIGTGNPDQPIIGCRFGRCRY